MISSKLSLAGLRISMRAVVGHLNCQDPNPRSVVISRLGEGIEVKVAVA